MTHIRPATLDDFEAINAVRVRNRLTSLDQAEWRRWWLTFPFREQFEGIPIGWVLEVDSRVVGVLSNVHLLYDFGGRQVKATVAAGWAVDPEHRNRSRLLLSTHFRQEGVDLWLNDSAAPNVSQLLTAMKMERIPAPNYDVPLLWPIRYRAFAAAALRRRNTPAAGVLAWPVGIVLCIVDWARLRGRGRRPEHVRRLDAFDERFDHFWEKLRSGPLRLRAVRTSSALQWRFHKELSSRSGTILVSERGELQGYAVLLHHYRAHLGLNICDIADLQADDPEVLNELLMEASRAAHDAGMEALKFAGGDGMKRSVSLSLSPYSYRLPSWQLFYKVRDAELGRALTDPETWDFSYFDTF